MRKRIRLGELLVEQKLITPEQLQATLERQKQSGGMLGHLLIELGFIEEEKLLTDEAAGPGARAHPSESLRLVAMRPN